MLKEKSSIESYDFYNVYGPYQNIKVFWELFFSSGLLEPRNMIMGGDLNLTLLEKENWEATTRQDCLSAFFVLLFDSKGIGGSVTSEANSDVEE